MELAKELTSLCKTIYSISPPSVSILNKLKLDLSANVFASAKIANDILSLLLRKIENSSRFTLSSKDFAIDITPSDENLIIKK